jgi:CHAD domain-containing protein
MSRPPRIAGHPTTADAAVPAAVALFTRRIRQLQRHLPEAIKGDDTGVHQARVASRRLREAVPVLAAGLPHGRKAARKVRRVTRALGTVREMDVTMQILDELARRDAVPRNALEDVRAHVIAERDRRRETMLARLHKIKSARLSRRLQQVADGLAAEAAGAWRQALADRVTGRARRLRKRIKAAGQMYAPEQLHDVRIATKKLRYALELAADAGIRPARPLVARLERTQETLGRLNDLHVIQHHVRTVQAQPPTRRGGLDGGLDVIEGLLEDECRHLHARYVKQVPALLDVTAACGAAVVQPLTAAARKQAAVRTKSARAPLRPTVRRD